MSEAAAPRIGVLRSGARDSIADVAGVRVGHCTLDQGEVQTGVTAILPHGDDLFMQKVPAGVAVINGFGKSIGLIQVQELGVLESPIILTNTFAVGTAATALTKHALRQQSEIGRSLPTLNPLVFECNDGYLNDLQAFAVAEQHVFQAIEACGADFAQGSVGAGRGMSAFGLKGGIGSASRRVSPAPGLTCTVGALVLANYGRPDALTIAGHRLGPALAQTVQRADPGPEKGSIIMVLATDAALDARQLGRVAKRAGAGLARTGSEYGHGSGDIALAFSTAHRVPQRGSMMGGVPLLQDGALDPLFQAAAECCEQAIVNALWQASAVTGRLGRERLSLREVVEQRLGRDFPLGNQ